MVDASRTVAGRKVYHNCRQPIWRSQYLSGTLVGYPLYFILYFDPAEMGEDIEVCPSCGEAIHEEDLTDRCPAPTLVEQQMLADGDSRLMVVIGRDPSYFVATLQAGGLTFWSTEKSLALALKALGRDIVELKGGKSEDR